MDITSLYNVSSAAVKQAEKESPFQADHKTAGQEDVFASILDSAMENINTTNSYISDAENEQIKFALGETESTHDLTVALQKASTTLQYTVTVRDKILEAYKEIMNIQI